MQQTPDNLQARAKVHQADRVNGLEAALPGSKVSEVGKQLLQAAFVERGEGIDLNRYSAVLIATVDVITHLEHITATADANKRSEMLRDDYVHTSLQTLRSAISSPNNADQRNETIEALRIRFARFYAQVTRSASNDVLQDLMTGNEGINAYALKLI